MKTVNLDRKIPEKLPNAEQARHSLDCVAVYFGVRRLDAAFATEARRPLFDFVAPGEVCPDAVGTPPSLRPPSSQAKTLFLRNQLFVVATCLRTSPADQKGSPKLDKLAKCGHARPSR